MRGVSASAILVCVMWAFGVVATQAAEQAPASDLTVCLDLSRQFSIGGHAKSIALAEVNTIWQPLGVSVRWQEGSNEGCGRLIAVKADHEARPEDMAKDSALGWVLFVEGRARQLVFLRAARIRAMVDTLSPGTRPAALTELLFARLLARSLAHELGHVLLNSPNHENSGLMRVRYLARDVVSEPVSRYTLSVAERTRLFAQIAGGPRLAQR